MYAIIAHSGKQYHVKPGLKFNIEKIAEASGEEVKLDQVLLFHDGKKLQVGTPSIAGTVVLARVLEHGRADKVRILKFKRRKHHMKRQGHRQSYTRIEVLAIGDAKTVKAPKVEKVSVAAKSKAVEKKSVEKKAVEKKAVEKKAVEKKAVEKKAVEKKVSVKKPAAKKSAVKKASTDKKSD